MFLDENSDPNEPIESFLRILQVEPDDDPHRLTNAGSYVALAVGGDATYYTPLDEDPAPDTVLAEKKANGQTLPSVEWIRLLRQRLLEIADTGVDPVFLTRSLAHYVADWYRSMGDTARADEDRARSREGMLSLVEDPAKLDSYRRRLAALDPEYASKSDDEIAEGLRRVADKMRPTSPDEALGRWASLRAWERDAADFLETS